MHELVFDGDLDGNKHQRCAEVFNRLRDQYDQDGTQNKLGKHYNTWHFCTDCYSCHYLKGKGKTRSFSRVRKRFVHSKALPPSPQKRLKLKCSI